jgi:DNA-binding NarL/FixJ family response regulator
VRERASRSGSHATAAPRAGSDDPLKGGATDKVKTFRVLVVVDDDPDVRAVVRAIMAADPRLEVMGEASSADEAVELARSLEPRVIILDHYIDGDVMGLEAAPRLKEVAPRAKILLFTAYDMAAQAKAEPAVDGYLRKDSISELLPTVLEMLALPPEPGGS